MPPRRCLYAGLKVIVMNESTEEAVVLGVEFVSYQEGTFIGPRTVCLGWASSWPLKGNALPVDQLPCRTDLLQM
jgi:hypothetical protein